MQTNLLRTFVVVLALLLIGCTPETVVGTTSTVSTRASTPSKPEFNVTVQAGLQKDVRLRLGSVVVAPTEKGTMVVSEGGSGVAFACDGSVVYLTPVGESLLTEEYATEVDDQADARGCHPEAVPPVSCLGLAGDPVACSED